MKTLILTLTLFLILAAFAWAESYTVVVSVDDGVSWRPIPLPARIVRHILDELAITHNDGQPRKTATVQIKMSDKKMKDGLFIIQCH